MLFFRKKVKGVILVIIGSYLLFGGIINIFFNYNLVYRSISGIVGGEFELNPFQYFTAWLSAYGLATILGIIGGLGLIFYSNGHFLTTKESDDSAIT